MVFFQYFVDIDVFIVKLVVYEIFEWVVRRFCNSGCDFEVEVGVVSMDFDIVVDEGCNRGFFFLSW